MSASAPSLKTDPLLAPFTSPTFSPITYLNSTLPSLPPTNSSPQTPLPSLAALTSQTQTQISTLSAQTARLSTTLTALTDDILRCSSRLAYEVELLRGEALGLVESLDVENAASKDDSLAAAMRRLLPPPPSISPDEGALQPINPSQPPITPSKGTASRDIEGSEAEETEAEPTGKEKDENEATTTTQAALSHLHTLLHVRALLTSTTQTFNAALSFPLPPSLLSSTSTSTTSSLISINPPNTNTQRPSDEERGQAALHSLRREIEELAAGEDGERRARGRIQDLRAVVEVWKGTGEEKARGRVVDGLEGVVGEVVRRREEEGVRRQGQGSGRRTAAVGLEVRERDGGAGGGAGGGGGGGGGSGAGRGFLEGLQRLRGEIGMD